MANRRSGRSDRSDGGDPFTWVVSLGCLAVGLALFLHSTMPALAEQRDLEQVERDLTEQTLAVEREVLRQRRRTAGIGNDPELLRVLLDERGLTPQEAIDLLAPELDPSQDDATATEPRR